MTPTLLAEYIAAVGLTVIGLLVLSFFIFGALGFFNKNDSDRNTRE